MPESPEHARLVDRAAALMEANGYTMLGVADRRQYPEPPLLNGRHPDIYASREARQFAVEAERCEEIGTRASRERWLAFRQWADAAPGREFWVVVPRHCINRSTGEKVEGCVVARTVAIKLDYCFTLPDGVMQAEAIAERRRSHRVLWRTPVVVIWEAQSGMKVRAHAETEVVNAHGALLRLDTPLPIGKQVELLQPQSNETKAARVVWSRKEMANAVRAVVELTIPSETFWGIHIPIEQAVKGAS